MLDLLIFIRIPNSPMFLFHSDYFRIINLIFSKGLFLHRNLHLPYH